MASAGGDGAHAPSARSFAQLMEEYDQAQREGGDGLLPGGGGGAAAGAGLFGSGLQLPGALHAGWAGLNSSLTSGVRSIGQSQYLQGTPLQAAPDLEAAEAGTGSGIAASAEASFGALSRSDRFKGFVALLLLSGFFFMLALFFLGVAVLFPAKFAFPFSMGSVAFMGAFALLQGPTAWARKVCSLDQLPFTLAYFGSIFGTLHACLVWRSYVMVVVFSVMQICALGYYAFGNMPGGQYGLRLVAAAAKQLLRNVFWPCLKGCAALFRSFLS